MVKVKEALRLGASSLLMVPGISFHFFSPSESPGKADARLRAAPRTIAPRLQLARRGAGATLFNDPEDCGLAAFDW